MGGKTPDGGAYRRALVATLHAGGHLRSARVAAALETVPREVFVPGLPLGEVYRPSDAIVVKRLDGVTVSSASAPEVIALMLEQLDARPGDSVLEIGAGTGYNAALLAHVVGKTGRVVSLDIDADLVRGAQEHLAQAGYSQVEVVQADGALGWNDDRVFNRIILTVASTDIAPAWRDQLAQDDGRLVLPFGLRGLQRSVAFKPQDDYLVSDSVHSCSFIPLRGLLASASAYLPLAARGPGVLTGLDEPLPLTEAVMADLLRQRMRTWPSGVSTSLRQLREGLHLWLATRVPDICSVWDVNVPDLFGAQDGADLHGTLCVVDARLHSLALLAWEEPALRAGELLIQAPVGADELVERIRRALLQWQAAGRPMDANLQMRAYARGRMPAVANDEVVLRKRWSHIVLNWRAPNPRPP